MARLNRDKTNNPITRKSRVNWLLLVNVLLTLGLYALHLLGK